MALREGPETQGRRCAFVHAREELAIVRCRQAFRGGFEDVVFGHVRIGDDDGNAAPRSHDPGPPLYESRREVVALVGARSPARAPRKRADSGEDRDHCDGRARTAFGFAPPPSERRIRTPSAAMVVRCAHHLKP